jgi:hypothetical protein
LKKTTILKGYSLDEAKFKRICGILGLDEDEIPSVMMDDFEMVLGWFAADKALSDTDAKKQYDEIKESRGQGVDLSGSMQQAFEVLVQEELGPVVAEAPRILAQRKQEIYTMLCSAADQYVLRELRKMKTTQTYPVLIEDNQPALPKGNG